MSADVRAIGAPNFAREFRGFARFLLAELRPKGPVLTPFNVITAVIGVATVVIAAGVIPRVAADTDPRATPQNAVPVSWGGVVLSLLVAGSLALAALRAGRGRRPSPVALGYLAFLALVLAVFGAPAVVFFTHGPAMRLAAVLGVLCSAVEFAVALVVGMTAVRLPTGDSA